MNSSLSRTTTTIVMTRSQPPSTTRRRRSPPRFSWQQRWLPIVALLVLFTTSVAAEDGPNTTTTETPSIAPTVPWPPFVTPPTSPAPTSSAPTTLAPTTLAPTTAAPVTMAPTTAMPSMTPSDKPSVKPTILPTSVPTSTPSSIPTSMPTVVPSSEPTLQPSTSPTTSSAPTSLTPAPTVSHAPTIAPTLTPTKAPTQTPTTTAPTRTPQTPVQQEVPSPTSNPTPGPMPSPTPQPTQSQTVNVVLRLEKTNGKLDEKTVEQFEDVTENFLIRDLTSPNRNAAKVMSQLLILDVEIYDQMVVNEGQRRRNLQQSSSSSPLRPLRVGFNTRVDYRESDAANYDNIDVSDLIKDAFNSPTKIANYIANLQRSVDGFGSLVDVNVLVDGERPKAPASAPNRGNGDDDDDDNIDLWIIVAAAGGGAIAILGILLLVGSRRNRMRKKRTKAAAQRSQTDVNTRPSTDSTSNNRYAAEINVDKQDDISTLGEPTVLANMMMTQLGQEDKTASVENYDYAKKFLGAGEHRDRLESLDSLQFQTSSSSASGFSKPPAGPLGHAVFADDESFEQLYGSNDNDVIDMPQPPSRPNPPPQPYKVWEVVIPPGKLGMVIDTPNNGVPMVHAIKPESVLINRVVVGDELIKVDDEDVKHMTAVQVSKLISVKAHQQRRLVFRKPNQLLDDGVC